MDETPTYVENVYNRTIAFKGKKTNEIAHTGNNKNRFTTCLTISAYGSHLLSY